MKTYAGIGSREVPDQVKRWMTSIAKRLARLGYELQSGGAIGSDRAFQDGSEAEDGEQTIFYADGWQRRSMSRRIAYTPEQIQAGQLIASRIHPAWHRCNEYARKLHGRNPFQILGLSLDRPVHFVITWTKGGQDVGGTRTAIVLARQHSVPIYNLAAESDQKAVLELLQRLEAQST